MPINVTIPEVGESITEGILAEWSKPDGAWVNRDEPLLVLETDKITMTVNAEESGALSITVAEGETVEVGQVVATIDTDAKPPATEKPDAEPASPPAPESAPDRFAASEPGIDLVRNRGCSSVVVVGNPEDFQRRGMAWLKHPIKWRHR